MAAYAATVGAGIGGQTTNNGRMFIALKPWDQRAGGTRAGLHRPHPAEAAEGAWAARCSCSAAQDIRVGGRLTKTEFQYTLQDADLAELYQWAPKILDKLKSAADAARRRHRPADVAARPRR